MTKAEEIRIQAVSPESTWGGDEEGVWAKATPAIKKLRKMNDTATFFISFLLTTPYPILAS